MHEDEPEMKQIRNLKEGSSERQALLDKLRFAACNEWNLRTIKKNKGEIILARRPGVNQKTFNLKDLGPCPSCKGWHALTGLVRHQKNCISQSRRSKTGNELRVDSDAIAGRLPNEATEALRNEVFPIITMDKVGKVACNDTLIVGLGNLWMERCIGNKAMRRYYTSSIMRLIARLLLKIHEQLIEEEPQDLWAYIHPKYYDTVLKAALLCCGRDPESDESLVSPSNGIKIGYDLKRLAPLKQTRAIVEDKEEDRKAAKNFLFLKSTTWGTKVTKLARTILSERKFNSKTHLHLPGKYVALNWQ